MWSRPENRRAALGWLAIAFACMLAMSSSALAMAPPKLTVSPTSPSKATDWTFTFAATADPLSTISGYEGGLVGSEAQEPTGPLTSPTVIAGLAEGVYFFRVRAVQVGSPSVESRSDYRTATIRVDRTPPAPPTPKFLPAQPNGTNGWYRSLTIDWSCSDPSGASCPDKVVEVAQRNAVYRQVAVDGAGNVSAEGATAAFNFDNGASQPAISSPSNSARVAGEPTFKWVKITDPTSGNNRFEIYARWAGGADELIARAPGTAVQSDRNVRTAPLPEGTAITWYVKFYDNAGNFRVSAARTFTILPTPPSAAPVITGGPSGPTGVATPTFSWSGDQPSFTWDVTLAGASAPVQKGSGAAKQTTLAALADGDYTLSVSQVTALGAEGPEATRDFTVDTVAPSPPLVTGRPAAPTAVAAGFAWTTEPGAFSRWSVVDSGGVVVKGPSDSPTAAVNVGALPSGAYTFRVAQIDAAGNTSGTTSEPFTVLLPAAAAATPPAPVVTLPSENAGRLTPRRGYRVVTLRPVFRWKKGPAGTTLYNIQIFRVAKREAGTAPTIVKILSAFPRRTSYRTTKRLRPGQCYVWRVWPYKGTSFTPKPLGISNFCVASAKVLKKNRARAKARIGARQQAGGVRVG